MKSVASIARITDYRDRLVAAQKLVTEASDAAEQARAQRDMATIVAHLDQGVKPVQLYRDTLAVSRGLFNRIIQRAPADEDRARIIAENPELFADAQATAKTAVKAVEKYTAIAEEAREIRDTAALFLMSGQDDQGNVFTPLTNAEIARLTDLTPARIAQVRQVAGLTRG